MIIAHAPLFRYDFFHAAATDAGLVRSINQDVVLSYPEQGFFAVVDGAGGLPLGGETAQIIRKIWPFLLDALCKSAEKNLSVERAGELLSEKLCQISDMAYQKGNSGGKARFGAAITCLWLLDNSALIVSLGDCRAYSLPQGGDTLERITKDHNLTGELLQRGEITAEEAQTHRGRVTLTRYIGMPAPAKADVFIRKTRGGDQLLLCSDGLYSMVAEDELLRLMREGTDPDNICLRMTHTANSAGGQDNIAVVYVCIEPTLRGGTAYDQGS